MKRKTLTEPTTIKEGIEWLKLFATKQQLRTVTGLRNRKLKRDVLIHAVEQNQPTLEDVMKQYDEHVNTKEDRNIERKKQHDKKQAWMYLKQIMTSEEKIITRIKPCVFYEWRNAHSGPGMFLIRHYGQEKSKMCVVVLDSWSSKMITIRTIIPQTLEYVSPPTDEYEKSTGPIKWQTWIMSENFLLSSCQFNVAYNQKRDEDDNYCISFSIDRADIIFSGTFVVAQKFVLHQIFPNVILIEIASFLF